MNKKKRRIAAFLIPLSAFALLALASRADRELEEKSLDALADTATRACADRVKELYGLELVGMGGGGTEGLNLLSADFHCPRECTLEEARAIAVHSLLLLLEQINSSEALAPHLATLPFTADHLKLFVSFASPEERSLHLDKPSLVIASCGNLSYYSTASGAAREAFTPYERMRQERFEEALIHLKRSQQLPAAPLHPSPPL